MLLFLNMVSAACIHAVGMTIERTRAVDSLGRRVQFDVLEILTGQSLLIVLLGTGLMLLVPRTQVRFEPYRPWQYPLSSLLVTSLNAALMLWSCIILSGWPIILASVMLVITIRRRSGSERV